MYWLNQIFLVFSSSKRIFSILIEKSCYIKSIKITKNVLLYLKTKRFFFVERNYFTHKREFLIIKNNFKKWKYYVKNEITIVIRIDYIELQYLKTIIKFSKKFTRWFVEFNEYRFDIRYKSNIKMIVLNILNRKNDFKLRSMQRTLNTIIFDEIVIIYTRDKNLFDEIKWNVELMKYENYLKFDENKQTFYQDFSHDNWIFYIEFWARANFLNFIHKTYEYYFANTILNIIRVR